MAEDRENRVQNILRRLYEGTKDTMGEGREDHREVLKRAYESKKQDVGANKINQMLGSNRTVSMIGDAMGWSDPDAADIRKKMGMGWSDDRVVRAGQVAGVWLLMQFKIVGKVWWLINAPQAAVNVIQEMALRKFAPNLYESDDLYVDQDTGKTATDNRMGNRRISKTAVAADIAYKVGDDVYTKKVLTEQVWIPATSSPTWVYRIVFHPD